MKRLNLMLSIFTVLIFLVSCSSGTNSSDSNTSSPDGTYTVSGNGITINVVVTGDKWTRISNNKVETGVVSAGYLYDEYQVNKIGEIYGDGTINFKGTTLSK
jgi:type 1 fimbria pilin|tara:strand:+ start:77 stop:382 length:306 start_codon:yes stop_codon:yes gene_type:complete